MNYLIKPVANTASQVSSTLSKTALGQITKSTSRTISAGLNKASLAIADSAVGQMAKTTGSVIKKAAAEVQKKIMPTIGTKTVVNKGANQAVKEIDKTAAKSRLM